MSLDVSLVIRGIMIPTNTQRIFIRESGQNKEISRAEWDALHPGREPITVMVEEECLFSANITHNLAQMASMAGIYGACWRPGEVGVQKAGQLIPLLRVGIEKMKAHPVHFKSLDAPNGWGTYEDFLPWLERYLEACETYPDASLEVSR